MKTSKWTRLACVIAATVTWHAHAAEDFQVRYNLAGSLGGEIFAGPTKAGWGMGVAATNVQIDKVTGADGKRLTQPVEGGTLAVPGAPAAVHPTYAPTMSTINAGGSLRVLNLAVAYFGEEVRPGQRAAFLVSVPFARKEQRVSASVEPPELNYPVPGAFTQEQRLGIQSQFAAAYQEAVGAVASRGNGVMTGLGDIELQAGWLVERDNWRVLSGAALVVPTGRRTSGPGPNVGDGDFYTLRPSVQASYRITPAVALAGKVSFGFNTRNRDTQVRSGNWVGLEGAVGYMTPIGPIGLHGAVVHQFQDDSGNPYGASRLKSANAGVFFTTKLPGTDHGAVTFQLMKTVSSRFAKSGTFSQIRLVYLF